MQVSIEATEGLGRRMTVEVPQERIEKEVDNRLRQVAKSTSIKGFRPGKVPMKEVKRRYGEQVRNEVVGEVVQSTFYEAVTKENVNPAGLPKIEPEVMEEGKDLKYIADFEVMPEVELASMDGADIEKTVAAVTDADVEKMIDTLRKQRSEWKAVKRKAKEDDRLNIDFVGTIDGEAFGGNEGKGVVLTLGSKRMIPGFEDGLVGAKKGEELTLDLTFPEDYSSKEVAGKAVQFAVTVNEVEEPVLPEIDDAFVSAFGIEGGVENLNAEVRKSMERELEQAVKGKIKQQVMDKLLELNDILVPQALVEREAETLANQMRQQMHIPQGKTGPELSTSMFEEQARRRVTLGLILSEVVQANELKADAEKVRAEVEKLASSYDQPEEVVKWYYGDKQRLAEVESLVLEEQVVDWVLQQAKVTDVEAGFDEVMNRG